MCGIYTESFQEFQNEDCHFQCKQEYIISILACFVHLLIRRILK
jgi:hypothetical protein